MGTSEEKILTLPLNNIPTDTCVFTKNSPKTVSIWCADGEEWVQNHYLFQESTSTVNINTRKCDLTDHCFSSNENDLGECSHTSLTLIQTDPTKTGRPW